MHIMPGHTPQSNMKIKHSSLAGIMGYAPVAALLHRTITACIALIIIIIMVATFYYSYLVL